MLEEQLYLVPLIEVSTDQEIEVVVAIRDVAGHRVWAELSFETTDVFFREFRTNGLPDPYPRRTKRPILSAQRAAFSFRRAATQFVFTNLLACYREKKTPDELNSGRTRRTTTRRKQKYTRK